MRVVLADDSVLFREGVARLLVEAGFEVTGQAGTAEELLELVEAEPPDVVIVDIRMPPTNTDEGLIAAQQIHSEHRGVGVLVLSQYVETHHVMKLIGDAPGSVGYLLKDRVLDLGEFADSVRRVASGGTVIEPEVVRQLVARRRERNPLDELTEREREVLGFMAEGLSNQAICHKLFLSAKTVESHVSGIFTKLGLRPTRDEHRRVLAVLTFLKS